MTGLIVTTDSSTAGAIQRAGLADIVIAIEPRLVWGRLPSDAELDAFFAPHTIQPAGLHWLDHTPVWRLEQWGVSGCGLIELVSRCDTAELWVRPEPNSQMLLLWALDQCAQDGAAISKLAVRHLDLAVAGTEPGQLAELGPTASEPARDLSNLAGRAWRAYRAPTPQAWFDLLETDLSLLPQLERCVRDLLEELPAATTGLGATEMRILELIAPGDVHPFDVFPGHQKRNERRVFGYWEVGALLDGLARCPRPAVSGLTEGPFTLDMHEDAVRHARYTQSVLSLTAFGTAVLAGEADFLRSNPIDRWWGGTKLTSERLWRWNPRERSLVAPG